MKAFASSPITMRLPKPLPKKGSLATSRNAGSRSASRPAPPMPAEVYCDATSVSTSRNDSTMDSKTFGSTAAASSTTGNASANSTPATLGWKISVTRNMTPSTTTAVREMAASTPPNSITIASA